MHKPESFKRNRQIKFSGILRYKWITKSWPEDQTKSQLKRKKYLMLNGFCCSSRPQDGNKRKQRDKYLDLARELRKLWNMMMTVIPIIVGALGTAPQKLGKGTRKIGNQRKNHDHPNYSIAEICQNPEKSPGDLRRLVLTWTPMNNHQLM